MSPSCEDPYEPECSGNWCPEWGKCEASKQMIREDPEWMDPDGNWRSSETGEIMVNQDEQQDERYDKARLWEALNNTLRDLIWLFNDPVTKKWNPDYIEPVVDRIKSVLQQLPRPPRNCDVGSGDEQLLQFLKKWKDVGYGDIDNGSKRMLSIYSRWSQMEYDSPPSTGGK